MMKDRHPPKASFDLMAQGTKHGCLADGRAACDKAMKARVTRAAAVGVERGPDDP
jgi:hypothetical protein